MFRENQILKGTYQILQNIGVGGTSTVFLAWHLNLEKYIVVKQLKSAVSWNALRTEADILKNLHHPNLPQIYDIIIEENNVYTVIDYIDGYSLEQYIDAHTEFTSEQIQRYLRQIGEVLSYLHSQNPPIIHSDIKPGNIMIDQQGNAVLIDFNVSFGANVGNLIGLTLPYASPEQIELARCCASGYVPTYQLDGRSDLFSLGATFYELITWRQPSPGVISQPLSSMRLNQFPKELLELIDRLMDYDPQKRPSSAAKLVHLIDRLDKRYLTCFALRCVSVLLSALLFAGGIYCLIFGQRLSVDESFLSEVVTAEQYISLGYLDQAEDVCDGILENQKLQAAVQKNDELKSRFYHAYGDIYYYREDYKTAQMYYSNAFELCAQDNRLVYSVYLRDAAISYALNQDLVNASILLEQGKDSGIVGADLLLMEIVLCARSGEVDLCVDKAAQLLSQCQDPEICRRAAVCVSSVVPERTDQIYWLETALAYDGGRNVSRSLALAYVEAYQEQESTKDGKKFLQKAYSILQELNASQYASVEDRLNYASALNLGGETSAAIRVLENALIYYPENDRILINLCFAYHTLQNSTKASDYCSRAIMAWEANTASDRLSEQSDTIQNLLELGRRYGIGGGS